MDNTRNVEPHREFRCKQSNYIKNITTTDVHLWNNFYQKGCNVTENGNTFFSRDLSGEKSLFNFYIMILLSGHHRITTQGFLDGNDVNLMQFLFAQETANEDIDEDNLATIYFDDSELARLKKLGYTDEELQILKTARFTVSKEIYSILEDMSKWNATTEYIMTLFTMNLSDIIEEPYLDDSILAGYMFLVANTFSDNFSPSLRHLIQGYRSGLSDKHSAAQTSTSQKKVYNKYSNDKIISTYFLREILRKLNKEGYAAIKANPQKNQLIICEKIIRNASNSYEHDLDNVFTDAKEYAKLSAKEKAQKYKDRLLALHKSITQLIELSFIPEYDKALSMFDEQFEETIATLESAIQSPWHKQLTLENIIKDSPYSSAVLDTNETDCDENTWCETTEPTDATALNEEDLYNYDEFSDNELCIVAAYALSVMENIKHSPKK